MLRSCYTSTAISRAPITFRRLLPPGDPGEIEEIVTGLGLHERSRGAAPASGTAAARTRPYVVLNMVCTLDGRATLDGRSGPISDAADRALFHGLRSVVDAVMAGAGTVRAERYGPIVPDPERRRLRARLGLRERPLACVVSASLTDLTPERVPLLGDPDSQVAIVTSSSENLPETSALSAPVAHVEYVRTGHADGVERALDLPAALAVLHDSLQVGTLLCEGGPHLNAQLLAAGLVDELFLSIAPLLAGGGDPADEGPGGRGSGGGDSARDRSPLRILAGLDFTPPLALELRSALERDSRLFLRYGVLRSSPPSVP